MVGAGTMGCGRGSTPLRPHQAHVVRISSFLLCCDSSLQYGETVMMTNITVLYGVVIASDNDHKNIGLGVG